MVSDNIQVAILLKYCTLIISELFEKVLLIKNDGLQKLKKKKQCDFRLKKNNFRIYKVSS